MQLIVRTTPGIMRPGREVLSTIIKINCALRRGTIYLIFSA